MSKSVMLRMSDAQFEIVRAVAASEFLPVATWVRQVIAREIEGRDDVS